MPQMSPLLWANLFIVFSILLLTSFVKIYFSTSKMLSLEKNKTLSEQTNNFSWTW